MKNTLHQYEVWADSESVTLATKEEIDAQVKNGMIAINAVKIHSFSAATPEEANAIYNLRMGYSSYIPMGQPEVCPNRCGSYFYPEGSGMCPYCGEIC